MEDQAFKLEWPKWFQTAAARASGIASFLSGLFVAGVPEQMIGNLSPPVFAAFCFVSGFAVAYAMLTFFVPDRFFDRWKYFNIVGLLLCLLSAASAGTWGHGARHSEIVKKNSDQEKSQSEFEAREQQISSIIESSKNQEKTISRFQDQVDRQLSIIENLEMNRVSTEKVRSTSPAFTMTRCGICGKNSHYENQFGFFLKNTTSYPMEVQIYRPTGIKMIEPDLVESREEKCFPISQKTSATRLESAYYISRLDFPIFMKIIIKNPENTKLRGVNDVFLYYDKLEDYCYIINQQYKGFWLREQSGNR